jgi:hypothetical protein
VGNSRIYTNKAGKEDGLLGLVVKRPGASEIATSGEDDHPLVSKAGSNHGKIGVSIERKALLDLWGHESAGSVTGSCDSSQNGRGGLFFVVEDKVLTTDLTNLIGGDTAPPAVEVAVTGGVGAHRGRS